MRLDETIVWRLSYMQTHHCMWFTQIIISTRIIKKNERRKSEAQTSEKAHLHIECVNAKRFAKRRKGRSERKNTFVSKATLLPYTLTLINKHATAHHLHHSFWFFSSFNVPFLCVLYSIDSICGLRTNLWMYTDHFGAPFTINTGYFFSSLLLLNFMWSSDFICSFLGMEDAPESVPLSYIYLVNKTFLCFFHMIIIIPVWLSRINIRNTFGMLRCAGAQHIVAA